MPSKASLPSALVDPVDHEGRTPQSIDSGGRHSSSRSKISSNSSNNPSNNNENPILKTFKSFRRKSDPKELQKQQSISEVNGILYRRPSFVITSTTNDLENGGGFNNEENKSLKPPDAINLTPPSPAPPPTNSFLKAPTFLKVRLKYLSQLLDPHKPVS